MIQDTTYGMRVELPIGYDEAVERTTAALKDQGFGVLTTIDVKETLKKKLDVDFRRYVILGACNPPLAHQAFTKELEIGLLLPCNVIVYETTAGRSAVAAFDPIRGLAMAGNDALHAVAVEADERLRKALAALEAAAPA